MRSLSLKWKIIVASGVPLLLLVGFCLNQVKHTYQVMQDSEKTRNQVNLIGLAAGMIHETQKERGKTAIFLNGETTLADLNSQRENNNKKIEALKDKIPSSAFSDKYKSELFGNLDKLEKLRRKVASKSIPLGEALGGYSKVIKRFLEMETFVADNTSLSEVSTQLRGFRILEDAKESGGKLRANMIGILAANRPITEKKFSTIVKLKAGVDANLSSSALKMGDEGNRYVSKFLGSQNWSTVNKTFALILKNSEKGNYYTDAKEFFNIITDALNIMGELVVLEKDNLIKQIEGVKSEKESELKVFTISLAALFVGLCFFIFYIVKLTNESIEIIKKIGERVASEVDEVNEASVTISTISSDLSSSSTEQASGLQETVSSIDEISSMIQRNADSANTSTQISTKSNEVATKGKEIVQKMVSSIKDISNSNGEIMTEMNKNNEDITKIVDVISEIGEKTKVINDIVFQTKLLSFNASVEAARAGEHGKGFAVVAEEVGNLASMSGKAALEITEMLDSSIRQVKDIVESAKSKVESLIKIGKEKVESGIKTAEQCDEALDEILQNVSSVNETIKEIASASSEQSAGVQEITKAMQQLDQETHKNTSSAQAASSTAHALKDKAGSLTNAVSELMNAVNGGKVSRDWDRQVAKNDQEATVVPILQAKLTPQNNYVVNKSNGGQELKVSGLDTSIPSDSDPRFKDL